MTTPRTELDQTSPIGVHIARVLTLAGVDATVSDAVIAAATITSAVIMGLNLGLRALLGQIAERLERPSARSRLQARLLLASPSHQRPSVLLLASAH